MIVAEGLAWGLAAVAVGVAWLCARAIVEIRRRRRSAPARENAGVVGAPDHESVEVTERMRDRS
jgi:hypothetical protein